MNDKKGGAVGRPADYNFNEIEKKWQQYWQGNY